MKLLALEYAKLRRQKIALIGLGMVIVQFFWLRSSLGNLTPQEHAQGWLLMLYAISLTDAVVCPITMAALASRSGEIEHSGGTLPLLCTLASRAGLYAAKLLWGAITIVSIIAQRTAVFTAIGLALRFPDVPWRAVFSCASNGVLISFALYAIELALSMCIANQAPALIVGIVGSFVGLFALFLPQGPRSAIIWSYYGQLSPVMMSWDQAADTVTYFLTVPAARDLFILALYLTVSVMAGFVLFCKKEA